MKEFRFFILTTQGNKILIPEVLSYMRKDVKKYA